MNKLLLYVSLFFINLSKKPNFIIEIKKGTASLKSGKVSKNFISDCQDVIMYENAQSGFIYGVKGQYGKLIIKASSDISPVQLQKIRNLWSFYS